MAGEIDSSGFDNSFNSASVLTTPFSNKSITIRLDETNYLLWKQMVFFMIKGNSLEKHIDGVKKRELSMNEYLIEIQLICDSLESCGHLVSKAMHISTILTRLPAEYEFIVSFYQALQSVFRGRRRGRGSRPQCWICGKIGHRTLLYYHRFDQSYSDESCLMSLAMSTASVNFTGFSNEAAIINSPLVKLTMLLLLQQLLRMVPRIQILVSSII
ncbi:hypothetical protein GOBAR_AA06071 [Gossypium barbadense]|uniref:Retrotransposon Copia-like N-terminal domain-containing protein n=1 Tax=Gossypium barbadense TaxID=3634 RepID=A0A2P5YG37_GOSBA|nr:hypothetical protein GOBAR_AA06071 [Gossypium barbadense]